MFRVVLVPFLSLLITVPHAFADYQKFIVGGEEAQKGEMPFMVSLQDDGNHFCGGSLISSDWVLTAAHCVDGGGPTEVVVGLHDQSKSGEAETFRPARIISHPKYNPSTMDYDYALIQLDGHSRQAPVRLSDRETPEGTNLVTAGWGYTREGGGAIPDVLRKVEVPQVGQKKCAASYRNETISDRMVCAGYEKGGKDSCQGDSGGPLFLKQGANPILVGVVSWGEGCARAGKYGVYSKVSAGLDWIDSLLH